MEITCRECRFFNNDPEWLENVFYGFKSPSSAYWATRGENGICSKLDLYISPTKRCIHFESLLSKEVTFELNVK